MKRERSEEEKAFLSGYDIAAFERPSLAVDIVMFSILNDRGDGDIRKLRKKSLKLLLIKRASHPYKSYWALPGGFCIPGEDVEETAKRELAEETNIKNAFLKLVGAFGQKDRDPRGWIISNTFLALMDGEKCDLRAGSDAWEARWFRIEVKQKERKRAVHEDDLSIETDYFLRLTNEDAELTLNAELREYKAFRRYHESVRYEIIHSDSLAFDHAQIILRALLLLRTDVENDLKMAFDLMPELFTLTQLQNAFELILDRKLLTANFRRKIADYVLETDKSLEGVGYRPAKLFKRNVEAFY